MKPTAAAGAAFLVVTVVFTWPLALHLGSALPGDYGDPPFIAAVMGWSIRQLTTGLTNPAALAGFWNLNIFYPEPGALAFSEHFVAQSVLVMPVYWATHNLLLTHNAATLLAFVLTAVCTFALVRSLTGSILGAALAGFCVAFNEYRLRFEIMHLQVLSIQWLPLGMLALQRYVTTRQRRWLPVAIVSIAALNLSSVYYLAYCTPFIAIFGVFLAVRHGPWRDLGTWFSLAATGAAALLITAPFVVPYFELQRRLGITRDAAELIAYSLSIDTYGAALKGLAVPGAFAAVGVLSTLLPGGGRHRRDIGLFSVFLFAAIWLSLGPAIRWGEYQGGWGLYGWLQNHIPGYSGLRAPSRYATLVLFFLGILAAFGVAAIEQWSRPMARVCLLAGLAFLVWAQPPGIVINQPIPSPNLQLPPPYLTPAHDLAPIYRAVEALPSRLVLLEFPFGDAVYEIRYMYFAALHGRRLANGYSGVFPPSYLARQRLLEKPLLDRARAADGLAGITHVIVHRAAWADQTGMLIGEWLTSLGATATAEADGAVLYEMRGANSSIGTTLKSGNIGKTTSCTASCAPFETRTLRSRARATPTEAPETAPCH